MTTEGNSKGWTFDTLAAHFDELRRADQEAVKVALNSYDERMKTTNEWRQTLTDLMANFVTKGQVAWAITAFFLALGAALAAFSTLGAHR